MGPKSVCFTLTAADDELLGGLGFGVSPED